MPPRTRKSAETAPPAPDTTTAAGDGEQQAPEAAAPETRAEPVSAATGSEQADTDATANGAPEAEASDVTPAAAARPSQPAYHWETTDGTPADPCRACPPGGPPSGVGSYGCPHGQWVRVQDAD